MSDRALRMIGYTAMGMIFFICTLVIIHWCISFITWNTLDSGWAQAIGSVVAIFGAFWLGRLQSKAAIQAIHIADDLQAGRKRAAIIGIAEAAATFAGECRPIFRDDGFYLHNLYGGDYSAPLGHLIKSFEAIPLHEIGTLESVTNLIKLQTNMVYLHGALTRAIQFAEAKGWGETGYLKFDTGAVHLNCDLIRAHVQRLVISLEPDTRY